MACRLPDPYLNVPGETHPPIGTAGNRSIPGRLSVDMHRPSQDPISVAVLHQLWHPSFLNTHRHRRGIGALGKSRGRGHPGWRDRPHPLPNHHLTIGRRTQQRQGSEFQIASWIRNVWDYVPLRTQYGSGWPSTLCGQVCEAADIITRF